ncbi:unnamed protein product [Mytilus coruscus]|uniref:Uncharacterized protein n=1 Tax=Mytilus coruscus TaxID=42192 RepID=A0A6J8AUG4_MYTCO|nr:unnamed protein product [Mytilus coruscus]
MIHNEHIDPTTTEPVPSNIHRSLGVDKLKLFAGIHIGIGVACMIACTVGLITNMKRKDSCCYDYSCMNDYSYNSDYSPNRKCRGHTTIMILYVTCLCLSLWYLLTGMIPLCMTDSRKPKWKCLKITFLVFSIISAVVFSPAMLSIGLLSIFIIIQDVVIFNPIQERVIHAVTQFQGPPVNQYGVLIPQGYQQQHFTPNTHIQIMTQQSPGQVLPPAMQGPQIQQHNGMANVN